MARQMAQVWLWDSLYSVEHVAQVCKRFVKRKTKGTNYHDSNIAYHELRYTLVRNTVQLVAKAEALAALHI